MPFCFFILYRRPCGDGNIDAECLKGLKRMAKLADGMEVAEGRNTVDSLLSLRYESRRRMGGFELLRLLILSKHNLSIKLHRN